MINSDWVQLNCRCKPIKVESCRLEYENNGRRYIDGKGVVDDWQVKKVYKSDIEYDRVYSESVESNVVMYHPSYKVERQPIRTSLANKVDYVYYKQTKIAEILWDMWNPKIDEATVLVRFDNKFLYGQKLYNRVCMFLEENNLVFHNWTRLDVCCDFNYLLNKKGKKEWVPSDFIKGYFNGDVRLLNKRRGKKRKGNVWAEDVEHIPVEADEFRHTIKRNEEVIKKLIAGNDSISDKDKEVLLNQRFDKQTMVMWFEDGESGIDMQTLRLGSKYSAVNTKMYNKTRELVQGEHDKPYIREQWALNDGIDITKEVWRLEFSITNFSNVIVDDDNFKMTMKTLDILKDENVELLWNVLREHYFQFYRVDKKSKDTNVTRTMAKNKLKLFAYEDTGLKLKDVSEREETTRAHKIFIKHLLSTQEVIRENNRLKEVSFASDYMAAWLVNRHDLSEWAKHRFPNWKFENYIEPPACKIEVVQFSMFEDGSMKAEKHKHTF